MTNGRHVPTGPNPNEFMFESGKKVRLKKVPQYLINDVERSVPMPEIPRSGPLNEENEADPDYLQAVEARKLEVGKEVMELAIDEGIDFDISDEQIEEELERFKEKMQKRKRPIQIEESLSMKTTYLLYICAASQQELQALCKRIFRVSQPTEEAITESVTSF